MTGDEVAEKIYQTLSKSYFAQWYGLDDQNIDSHTHGRFSQHICGDIGCPEKSEIIDDIKKMFNLE